MTRDEHTSSYMDANDFHSQPWGRGGLDRVTLRVVSKLTPSEAYLGLLTPVTFLVLITMAASHRNCQHNQDFFIRAML